MTVLSTGGDGIGASKITGDVMNVAAQGISMIKGLTGIDIAQNLHQADGKKNNGGTDGSVKKNNGNPDDHFNNFTGNVFINGKLNQEWPHGCNKCEHNSQHNGPVKFFLVRRYKAENPA